MSKNRSTTVSCPGCGRDQPKQSTHTIYWCEICQSHFDDSPDEGGDYYTDPTRRAEQADERKARRRSRR